MVRRKSPMPLAVRDDKWRTAVKKNKLCIYYQNEPMPRYTFEKKAESRYWVGYGQTLQSIPEALLWVKEQALRGGQK